MFVFWKLGVKKSMIPIVLNIYCLEGSGVLTSLNTLIKTTTEFRKEFILTC